MIATTLDTLSREIEYYTLERISIGHQAKKTLLILAGIHPTLFQLGRADTEEGRQLGLLASQVLIRRLPLIGLEHLCLADQSKPKVLARRDLFALNVTRLNYASDSGSIWVQVPDDRLQTVVVKGLQNTAFALMEKRKYEYASDRKVFKKKEDELAGIIKGGLALLMNRIMRRCNIQVGTQSIDIKEQNPKSLFTVLSETNPFAYAKYRTFLTHDLVFHGDTVLNRVNVFPPIVRL